MFNKKGVSAVVANVLIILLVVVGVALIWAAVRPALKQGTDEVQNDCFTIVSRVNSCSKDTSNNNINVQVERDARKGTIKDIKFIFGNANNEKKVLSIADSNPSSNPPRELGSSIFTFSESSLASESQFPSIADVDSVDISIVIGNNKICNAVGIPVKCE